MPAAAPPAAPSAAGAAARSDFDRASGDTDVRDGGDFAPKFERPRASASVASAGGATADPARASPLPAGLFPALWPLPASVATFPPQPPPPFSTLSSL